jgi:glycosyltransferase involved in cell wall biosynthesis
MFVWLRTFPYRGNDWRRMANMASYAVVVVLAQIGRPAPDVVVGSTVHPFAALAGWIIARLRRARFFYEIRDLWPQTLIDLGAMRPNGFGARLLYAIESFLVRRAEVVMTLLPGVTTYLDERGLPSSHVRYLPNGFDLTESARPRPTTPDPRVDTLVAELARRRADGEVLFVYLGAHGRVNSLDVVLRAWQAATAASAIPIRLLMVGDGPEKPRLEALAGELGLAGIEFHEPVRKDRVMDLLGNVDVGIVHTTYTPVYRYGVSFNKLFDYMAAGLPVAFATATANDPIEASGGGLTVAPDDPAALAAAFVQMAEAGPDERRRIGAAGRSFVERHHDMGRIADTFAELVARPAPTGGSEDRPYTPRGPG